jgi:hypothetical protein
MALSDMPKPEPDERSEADEDGPDLPLRLGSLLAALTSIATLPRAFEQYPKGAAIFTGLFVFALICWVAVTWLKHRR